MAREHARILCRIWSDEEFKERTKGAQWMYFALLSQRSLNHAGVLPLTVHRWANGSKGTTADNIMQYLRELSEHGYVVFDVSTEELLIRSFIRNDGVARQPNVLKAALRQALEVDSKVIRLALAKELLRLQMADATAASLVLDPDGSTLVPEPFGNPSGTLSEPLAGNPSGTLPDGYAANVGEGEGESLVVKSPSVVGSVGAPSQAKSSAAKRGTRLPEDWRPSPAMVAYAHEHGPSLDLEREVPNFVDYWVVKPGKDGVKLDWDRTWQRWVRTSQQRIAERGGGRPRSTLFDASQIDPDEVLGKDTWTVPTPPREIRDGPHEGLLRWDREKRAERRAVRVEEARRVLERKAA